MDGDDPVGLEVLEVNREGLFRQEMHRDRVAAESVEREEIEVLWLLAREFILHLEAGVAHDNVEFCGALFEVGERIAGEFFDGGVDFVEANVVAGFGVDRK